MAVTVTYNIPLFAVGGDNNAWGGKYNSAMTIIDALLAGKLDASGGAMTGPLELEDGSVGVPAEAFVNDSDSGRYLISAGHVGEAIGGALVGEWDANGLITSLQGRVNSAIVHKVLPYETDANNGGAEVWVRSAGALVKRARYDENGHFDVLGNIMSAVADIAAGTAVDCRLAGLYYKTITGNTVLSFTNVPATRAFGFLLELTNGGAFTITWPGSVKWPLGIAPALTAAGVDLLGFFTRDGGTTWRGALLQKGSA